MINAKYLPKFVPPHYLFVSHDRSEDETQALVNCMQCVEGTPPEAFWIVPYCGMTPNGISKWTVFVHEDYQEQLDAFHKHMEALRQLNEVLIALWGGGPLDFRV